MKFGIMEIQYGELVPQIGSAADPAAFVANFDHAALIRKLNRQGFTPIELTGDMGFLFPQAFNAANIASLDQLTEESGVRYTNHLPLWSVEPASISEEVRLGSVQALINGVRAVEPLNPSVHVMHAFGSLASEFYRMRLPAGVHGLLLRQFQTNARRSIETLLKETGLPSRRLAIETVEFPFDLTLELAEQLDLSICLDTGHILSGFSGDISLWDALERSFPRLAEIHLHDAPQQRQPNLEYGKDHKALGTGDLPIERFLDRLVELGYDGPIILEMTLPEAIASLQTIRSVRSEWVDDTDDVRKWQ